MDTLASPDPLAESALLAERLKELMAKATPDDWLATRVFRPEFDNDRVSVILIGDDAWLAELLFDNLSTLLAALDGREAESAEHPVYRQIAVALAESLNALRRAVVATKAMEGRDYIDLGIQVQEALAAAYELGLFALRPQSAGEPE